MNAMILTNITYLTLGINRAVRAKKRLENWTGGRGRDAIVISRSLLRKIIKLVLGSNN